MGANPYEELYRKDNPKRGCLLSMEEAEQMSIHMSQIYNVFSICLKDVVGLLSLLYKPGDHEKQSINEVQKVREKSINEKQTPNNINSLPKLIQQEEYCSSQIPHSQPISIQTSQINITNQEKQKNLYSNSSQSNLGKNSQTGEWRRAWSKPSQFARIEKVRNRTERQTLNGYSCIMCEKFYKALGQDYTDRNGENKLCTDCSRHRSNLPPTNYFTNFSQEFGFD